MQAQKAPSEPGVGLQWHVITAGTNSKCSLHNHIPVIGDGNRLTAGQLHYSSRSSAVISSRSWLKRLMISKGIQLQHWNCWPRGKFWILPLLPFCPERWPRCADTSVRSIPRVSRLTGAADPSSTEEIKDLAHRMVHMKYLDMMNNNELSDDFS